MTNCRVKSAWLTQFNILNYDTDYAYAIAAFCRNRLEEGKTLFAIQEEDFLTYYAFAACFYFFDVDNRGQDFILRIASRIFLMAYEPAE